MRQQSSSSVLWHTLAIYPPQYHSKGSRHMFWWWTVACESSQWKCIVLKLFVHKKAQKGSRKFIFSPCYFKRNHLFVWKGSAWQAMGHSYWRTINMKWEKNAPQSNWQKRLLGNCSIKCHEQAFQKCMARQCLQMTFGSSPNATYSMSMVVS